MTPETPSQRPEWEELLDKCVIFLPANIQGEEKHLQVSLKEFIAKEREKVARAMVVPMKEHGDPGVTGEWANWGWNVAREEQIRLAKELGINLE